MLGSVKHHSGHHHRAESRRRRKYPPGPALLQTHAWGQADDAGRVPPRSGRPRRQPREASEQPGHQARRTPFRPSYWPSRPPGGHLSASLIGVTADEHGVIHLGSTYALLLIRNGPPPAPSPLRGRRTPGHGLPGPPARTPGAAGPGRTGCRPGHSSRAGQARTTSAASPGAAGACAAALPILARADQIRTMPRGLPRRGRIPDGAGESGAAGRPAPASRRPCPAKPA
jgi:hypothetical protein